MEYIEYIALYTVSIASNLQPLLIFNRGFFMLGGNTINAYRTSNRGNKTKIQNSNMADV